MSIVENNEEMKKLNDEKNSFFENLRLENEKVMTEYKIKMEHEFQNRLRILLQDLKSVESTSRPSSASPISPHLADRSNAAFFAASQRQESAPVIAIYENNHRGVKLRATTENSDIIQPSVIGISGKVLTQAEAEVPSGDFNRLRPGLEPYTKSLVPKDSSSPKNKLSKSDRKLKKKEMEDINRSIEGDVSADSYQKYQDRMLSTTRDAVLKSQRILEETKKLTKKHSRRKKDGHIRSSIEDNNLSLPSILQPSGSSSALPQPYQTVVVSGSKSVYRESKSGFPNLEKNEQHIDVESGTNDNSHPKPMSSSQKRESKFVTTDINEGEREGYLNKFDWENLLARHILSVYATSHSQSNSSETRAVTELLEMPLSPPTSAEGKRPRSKNSSIKLKETGLFNNLQKERKGVEKQSIRPAVTSRSTIMMLGRTATANPLASSMGDLNSTTNISPKSSRPATAGDPMEDVAFKSVEKLHPSHRKQRNEIKTTSHTNGIGSVIRAPAKCFPIWFYSSGDVYAEWVLLPNGAQLQSVLDSLMEKKNYLKYTEIVGRILDDCWIERIIVSQQQPTDESTASLTRDSTTSSRRKKFDVSEVVVENRLNASLTKKDLQSLCRQYILACNAFATVCLENKDYSTAMILIRNAEEWLKREDIFEITTERLELKGYIHITFAFYFHKKKMTSAALSHSQQALDINRKLQKDDYVAMCLLMISCCKYQVSNFKEAHKILYQVLEMVEAGRLAFHEANPKELCMIAVAYHNLAVIQMKLQVPDAAAKSSQNARKIARLCLSYSNRWITVFHWTHQLALEDVKYQLDHNMNLTEQQKKTMKQLTELYFEPHAL